MPTLNAFCLDYNKLNAERFIPKISQVLFWKLQNN